MIQTNDTEYPVDPKDIVLALSQIDPVGIDSGFIPSDVFYIREKGSNRIVASYREPQVTGIWLDGSDEPLRVPLPGLVMIRRSSGGKSTKHNIIAVKERPTKSSKCFIAPIPNVSMTVCWGNVATPVNVTNYNNLTGDWENFFGTRFGNHSVAGKCVSHRDDVRKLFIELSENNAQEYPETELIEENTLIDRILT